MIKKHISITYFCLVMLLACAFTSSASSAATSDSFDSYTVAVYDKILNGSNADVDVFHISMSSDGSRIYFTGAEKSTDKMIVGHINSDGSGIKTYDAPGGIAFDMVVNGDGSRSFFIGESTIYKIEDNTVSEVVDMGAGNYLWGLGTTDSGDYVYCSLSGRKGVLKFNHDGGNPAVVVQGNDIELDDNATSSIQDFAVSDDGQVVAFLVDGYVFDNNTYDKPEVFSSINGAYNQLTATGVANDGFFKTILDVSGDGKKILYIYKDNHFIVSSTDSSSKELNAYDGWGQLDGSGQKMFVSDNKKGLIVDTASKEELILFPVEGIDIDGDIDNTFISNDGRTISFTVSDPDYKTSIYVGHFYADAEDIVPNSSLQSTNVDYSDSDSGSEQESSGSEYENVDHETSENVKSSSTAEDDVISEGHEQVIGTADGKVTETDSSEKTAGYGSTTLFLVSVFGLCSMVLNRKD